MLTSRFSALMDALGFDRADVDHIKLADLQSELEKAVAAVLWRGRSECGFVPPLTYLTDHHCRRRADFDRSNGVA